MIPVPSWKLPGAGDNESHFRWLRELLESSLASLGEGPATGEEIDSLAVRRELAAASVNALGDFWGNEIDTEWQTFQP